MIQRINHYVETFYVILNPKVDDIRAVYSKGSTIKQIAQSSGADIAMNFNYANTTTGDPIGRVIVDGKTVVQDIAKTVPRDELYMLPDRSLHIGKAPANAVWAVQGSPPILRGGKNVVHEGIRRDQTGEDIWKPRAIRAAAGITADGRLVLARTTGKVYLSELAEIMTKLGCVDALNADGGGSAYLWPNDTASGRKLGSAIVVKKGVQDTMRINDIQISKNFKLYEFECKDGSHQVVIHPKLLELAQKLRDRIGKPVVINSAYRTAAYNKQIGGSPDSQHLLGKAIDVKLPAGMTVDQLAAHGKAVGFTGVGKYSWGCHFDVRETRSEWDYR